jgi:hypothetical protein
LQPGFRLALDARPFWKRHAGGRSGGTQATPDSAFPDDPHRLSWSGMEYFFACPYCSEQISMVLDTSVKRQTYIEDCEVCCRPIQVRYTVQDDEIFEFDATAI